jgi:hypothetical protein
MADMKPQEAELVFRGQSEGLPVEHRSDISPLALLGVRLVTAAASKGHATSPGHSWDVVMPGWR